MKRAWITGSQGFVGPWLAQELQGRGVEIYGIDRPGREGNAPPQVRSLQLSLRDEQAVREALESTRPDVVFHLAAQSSAALSFQRPAETLEQNLLSTTGLLEALRACGEAAPALLSVGSCEEYGPVDEAQLPVTEDHPLRPASPYAVSKAAQTLLCLQYYAAYGLPIICTRSFTHTGPRQSDRFVFSSFARQIAEQERDSRDGRGKLAVGNLAAVRDVSDVRDVARAYVELVERGRAGEVYNVCSGRGVAIREALDMLLSHSTLEIEIGQDPARLRPLDVPIFIGDASKLHEALGWTPSTPLEKSLGDLLEYWRERLSREGSKGRRA